ncbi:MAG: cupin domain-containing protein [Porticoccaceae bacterium]|nr:cupin domain-containing protein [Porticoccaceae bacterium]
MIPGVRRLRLEEEYFIDEGCHIVEVSNSVADPALSLARARVEPGVTTRWHLLEGIAERYVILAGRGCVEVGDLPPREVGVGDVVLVPPGIRQRIANSGDTDLVFFCVCTPRFDPAAYRDLDA